MELMTARIESVTTLSDAVQRAAAATPDRTVLTSGWESAEAFIFNTEDPTLPPMLRHEEEDGLVVRVEKSTGNVTEGTFVAFISEIVSATEL